MPVVALVVCGAPLAWRTGDMVAALADAGWVVRLIATPAAAAWIEGDLVPQVDFRSPRQPKTYPDPDVLVVCPATFNTLNKIALGLADNYATALACEMVAVGRVLIVPMVSAALRGHPAFDTSVATLRVAGVEFLDGSPESVDGFQPAWLVTALGQIA
jgi:phosphopantothenoylcysteine synthetase/decarboxylase